MRFSVTLRRSCFFIKSGCCLSAGFCNHVRRTGKGELHSHQLFFLALELLRCRADNAVLGTQLSVPDGQFIQLRLLFLNGGVDHLRPE